jgi:hypothetical protein
MARCGRTGTLHVATLAPRHGRSGRACRRTAACASASSRVQVLAPALQQLVELPDWGSWLESLKASYPFPEVSKSHGT